MGTAERKLREKEQRRQYILDTAERLFFKTGPDTITMDELAVATELSKGTLYLYFRNKEALFLAINVRAKKLLRQLMEESLKKAPSADNGLNEVLCLGRAYIAFAQQYPDYYQMTLRCFVLESTQLEHDQYAEEAHYHGEKAFELLVQALHRGQQDGSIASQLNVGATAMVLWGQINGLMQILEVKGAFFQDKLGLDLETVIAENFTLSLRMLAA